MTAGDEELVHGISAADGTYKCLVHLLQLPLQARRLFPFPGQRQPRPACLICAAPEEHKTMSIWSSTNLHRIVLATSDTRHPYPLRRLISQYDGPMKTNNGTTKTKTTRTSTLVAKKIHNGPILHLLAFILHQFEDSQYFHE